MSLPEIPNYEFLELIGEGSCGIAYRCRYRGQDERVVKVVKALAVNGEIFVPGIKTVAAARPHHHLVDVCGYEFVENPGYFITSLHGASSADGTWKAKTLESLMGRLKIDDALKLIDQMADGLAHLHRLEVAHTGFKPGNVFVDENPDGSWRVRIADWGEGLVKDVHYLELHDRGFYAAPEQLATGDFSRGKGKRWDVYAFGVVAYRLLTGLLPRLDPQFDNYLELQKRLENREPDALAYAQLLEEPQRYVEWIAAQPEVRWPGQPRNQAEADQRKVIERCLELDPEKRFGDMREVVSEFRQVESAFLLRRIERDLNARQQQMAEGYETKLAEVGAEADQRRKQVIKWRVFAVGLVAIVTLLGWGAYQLAKKEIRLAEEEVEELRREAMQKIAEERLRFDMALAEKDTVVATVERTVEQRSAAADAARDVLRRTQAHGDRFFELILDNRNPDAEEYREQRRLRVLEAREHYEALLEVYANNNGFVAESADAYRFLGEIYLELGEPQRATKALAQSATRLANLRQSGDTQISLRATESLAKVRQRQAELIVRQAPAGAEALQAIPAAQELWGELAAQQPDELEWRLQQAKNQYLLATVKIARGAGPEGMADLELAADSLVVIHEQNPENDEAAATLGRVFLAIGKLLGRVGELEQAGALLDQSIALFSEAVTLNSAIPQYQMWMAESLAELGGMRRDPQMLNDAVTVLTVARKKNTADPGIATALAASLGSLAEMQRDGGETAAAVDFEMQAVEALRSVVEGGSGDGSDAQLRYLLAEHNIQLAELQGDQDQFSESRNTINKAIELLGGLIQEQATNTAYQRLLARAQGLAAFASEKIDDKARARELYAAALTQWQAIATAHPEDEEAVDGLDWAKRQLDGLPKQ